MGRFKITDIDNEKFYQIPKSLFTNENYKGLGLDAKVIYSFLKDRMELSRKNNWKDENGDIYLLFTQEEIANLLDVSISTISRAMKYLKEYDLIEVVRQGLSKPNKIFIRKISVVRRIKTCTDDVSRPVTDESLDLHPRHTNDTDINKTEYSETEKSIGIRQPKQLKHNFAEFVSMTNDEYSSLIETLGSEESVKACIDILDNYKGSNGKKYKSDYRAIKAWVIEKYKKEFKPSLKQNVNKSNENPQMEMARKAMEMIVNG